MYIEHVCFYVCCSDCVGACGNVCCVAAVVEGDHMEEAYSRASLTTALYVAMSVSFCLPHPVQ